MNHEEAMAWIDAWIAKDPYVRCVVYSGEGEWWPADITNDGPQEVADRVDPTSPREFSLAELAAWCQQH